MKLVRGAAALLLACGLLSCGGGGSTHGAPGAGDDNKLPDPPKVQSFAPVRAVVTVGDVGELKAAYSGATAAEVSCGNWKAGVKNGEVLKTPVLENIGFSEYKLTVLNNFKQTAVSTTKIETVPKPTASLTSSSPNCDYGGSVTVIPVFTDGAGTIAGFGAVESGKEYRINNLTESGELVLTVVNRAGCTVIAKVAVSVKSVVFDGLTPANLVATSGRSYQFQVQRNSGGATNGVRWSTSVGAIDQTGRWVAPLAPGEGQVTATCSDDPSKVLTAAVRIVPVPEIKSFEASSPVPFGGSANLRAVFSGKGFVDGGIGEIVSGQAKSSPALRSSVTYTLTVTNEAGDSVESKAAVVVTNASISNITPANLTISVNESITFQCKVSGTADSAVRWSASGGSITESGVWTAPPMAGNITIKATAKCNAELSSITTVNVVDAPRAISLIAEELSVPFGGSTNITPNFAGGYGSVDHSIGKVVSGKPFTTGSLSEATTYTLLVKNDAGKTDKRSITVDVVKAGITGVSPAGQTVTVGDQVQFKASVTNAANIGVNWSCSAGEISASGLFKALVPGTYTITATSQADTNVNSSTTLTVVAAPSISSFTTASTTVAYGGKTTLMPSFSGGVGEVDQSIGVVSSGNGVDVGPLLAATTYTLRVTNAAGAVVTAQVTVTVSEVQVSGINPVHPIATTGDQVQFHVEASGGVDNSVSWAAEAGDIDASGLWTAPAQAGTYTITATSKADRGKSTFTSAQVVLPPAIQNFSAAQASIPYGGSTSLLAEYRNGEAQVDQGIGSIATGVSAPVGPLYATTEYLLTVANLAGKTVTRRCTVVVSPVVLGQVTPAALKVSPGAGVQFAAAVTGAVDSTVVWTATGGAITNSGAWTAPAQAGTYTITATSKADSKQSTNAIVEVVGIPKINIFELVGDSIPYGGNAVLNVSYENGTGTLNTGNEVKSGTPLTIGPLVKNTTITLTVDNGAGSVVHSSILLEVQSVNVASINPASPKVTIGDVVQFSTSITGAADSSIVWNANGGDITTEGKWTASVQTGTYTITAASKADPTKTMSTTVQVYGAPAITSFTVDKATITQGSSANLIGSYRNGVGEVDSVGPLESDQPKPVSPMADTTYTLTVRNAAGQIATKFVTVHVVPAASISSFTVSPSKISRGGACVLKGSFVGGTGQIDRGIGSVVSGEEKAVSPTADTTYTLTTTNAAGDAVSKQVTVQVFDVPSIDSFAAAKPILTSGKATTLKMTFSNGTGFIEGIGAVSSGASIPITPNNTTEYTLKVTNGAGDITTAKAVVTVVPAASISSFTAAKNPISVGESTTLTATYSGGEAAIDNGLGAVSSGTPISVVPDSTTTYTLSVTNAAGDATNATLRLKVVQQPKIIGFSSGKPVITKGKQTTLLAEFSNGTGSVDCGVGTIQASESKPISPEKTTSYTLTVVNEAGVAVTKTITVKVVEPPSVMQFSSSKLKITKGEGVNLEAKYSGGIGVVDHGVGNIQSGSAKTVTPTSDMQYTLTVINEAGDTATALTSVLVYDVPEVLGLLASKQEITSGESTTIRISFRGGAGNFTGRTGSQDVQEIDKQVVNGEEITVEPGQTEDYTLTVTNPAGYQITSVITITVIDWPYVSEFSAAQTKITVGTGTILKARYTGVNGTIGSVGPISNGGTCNVAPLETTTYTLTVENKLGAKRTASIKIDVLNKPLVERFTSDVSSIVEGNKTNLVWTIRDGTATTITGSDGSKYSVSGATGSFSVSPELTCTYTITAVNPIGYAVTATTVISVTPAPLPTIESIKLNNVTYTETRYEQGGVDGRGEPLPDERYEVEVSVYYIQINGDFDTFTAQAPSGRVVVTDGTRAEKDFCTTMNERGGTIDKGTLKMELAVKETNAYPSGMGYLKGAPGTWVITCRKGSKTVKKTFEFSIPQSDYMHVTEFTADALL